MDPNLILQGRSPNFAASMGRGLALRATQNALGKQEALDQLYQAQGQGIAAGDPMALNALAQVDPDQAQQMRIRQEDQAYQMQDRAQSMQIDRERLEIARQEARMKGEEYARTLSAEQRAQQAEDIERGLAGAVPLVRAGDEAGYNAWLQSQGMDPAQFPMSNFASTAASLVGLAEALKSLEPAKPADEYERYVAEETAAGRQPLSRLDFIRMKSPSTVMTTGPNGTTVTTGVGASAGAGKPTEGNLSSSGYLQRMTGAEAIMDDLEKQGVTAIGLTDTMAVGTRFEPYKLTVPEQKLLQAQRDWVRAKLRKESGAVIGEDEMAAEIMQYFPQPGEGKEIAAQKREARKRAERQLEIGAGPAAAEAGPLTDAAVTPSPVVAGEIPPPPEGFTPEAWGEVWGVMSPEDRALFQ